MQILSGSRSIPIYLLRLLCLCLFVAGTISIQPTEGRAASDEMTRIVQERNRVESNLKGLKIQLEEYQLKLKKTRKDEVLSMDALKNIRKQILVYERLINENQTYLNSLDREISYLQNQLEDNRKNYHRVSSDFERVAVAAYKQGGNRDAEMVFASNSVNDAMIRTRYMGFLSRSVKSKVTDLQTSAQQMEAAQVQLQQNYRQKEQAMKAQREQLLSYSSKQKEKEAVLSDIKKNRSEYAARITEVRKKQREMQSKIESLIMAQQELIQREQERARLAELKRQKERQARVAEKRRLEAEQRRKAAADAKAAAVAAAKAAARVKTQPRPPAQPQPSQPMAQVPAHSRQQQQGRTQPQTSPGAKLPPAAPPQAVVRQDAPAAEPQQEEAQPPIDPTESEIDKVSVDFDASGSSLPWPVRNGVIVRRFGSSLDKELNLVTTSNGIDISVPVNTPVKAVSGGKVAQIAYLPTFGNVVIIRHPKSYLTVYANLARVSVAKGEVIRSQHLLGNSGPMPEGGSIVHFEVWKGKIKQNPQKWLR
ncbi:MAG: peptidoglycan DD-metalloendopeptidase family protein [Chlorobiaceae bacterium]|nr:peptidoglycan DD-metalloendopeptidase family protein [Chlorobiaceae bacterium]